jgi:hypothetical protein
MNGRLTTRTCHPELAVKDLALPERNPAPSLGTTPSPYITTSRRGRGGPACHPVP